MAEQFRSGRPTYPVPPAPPPMQSGADMIRLLTRGAGSAAMAGANYMRTAGPQPVMFPGGVTPPAPAAAPQPAGMDPLSTLPDLAEEAETRAFGPEADSASLMALIQQAQADPSPTLRQQIVDMVGRLTSALPNVPNPAGMPPIVPPPSQPQKPGPLATYAASRPKTPFGRDLREAVGALPDVVPSGPPPDSTTPEWAQQFGNYFTGKGGVVPRGFTGNMPGANMTPAETIAMATGARPGAPAGAPNPATAPTMGPATPNPLVRPPSIPLPQPNTPPVAAAPGGAPAAPGAPASPQAQAAAAMLSSGQQPPATAAALTALANPQAPAVAAAPAKDRFGLTDDARRNMATIGAMTALGAAQPGATLASALAGGVVGGLQADTARKQLDTARKEREGASALKTRELNIQEANYRQQTAARIDEISARREATALASLDRQDAIAAREAASKEMADLRRLQIEADSGNKRAMADLQAAIAEGRNNDAAADYINEAIKTATGNGMTPETPAMRSAAERTAAQAYPNSAIGQRWRSNQQTQARVQIDAIRASALPDAQKAEAISKINAALSMETGVAPGGKVGA